MEIDNKMQVIVDKVRNNYPVFRMFSEARMYFLLSTNWNTPRPL